MRGRKIDAEFISQFIASCIRLGHDTPATIVSQANQEIYNIDEEIKRVEKLKITRSKLLDVVLTLNKSDKVNKSEEARILPFFKIQHPDICKFICNRMKNGVVTLEDLGQEKYSSQDIIFCIKQLLENKVVAKSGGYLLRGEMFDDYFKFVLQEK